MARFSKYIILLLALTVASCVGEEKDIFDLPASERMQKELNEIRTTLTSAPNGWLMEYYAQPSYIGGVAMIVTFKANGEVAIQGEEFITGDASEVEVSSYIVKNGRGPIISFDSYNSILHRFSDPTPGTTANFNGDYEFTVISRTADEIQLKGILYDRNVKLRRLASDVDHTQYLNGVGNISQVLESWSKIQLTSGNAPLLLQETGMNGRVLSYTIITDEGRSSLGIPFAFTDKGLRFQFPLLYNGKPVQTFEYSTQDNIFVCTDPGVDAKIENAKLEINDLLEYSGFWGFQRGFMSEKFEEIWREGVASVNAIGYPVYYARMGMSPSTSTTVLEISIGTSFTACFYGFEMSAEPGTTDKVRLTYTEELEGNATFILKNAPGLLNIFQTLGYGTGRVYTLTVDDEANPQEIHLVADDDPTISFTLFKTLYANP